MIGCLVVLFDARANGEVAEFNGVAFLQARGGKRAPKWAGSIAVYYGYRVTNAARVSALSAALDALREAKLEGVFLAKETTKSVVELEHNARRESTLHVKTDLFEARAALERAGFEAFELGAAIIARQVTQGDPRPGVAKIAPASENAKKGKVA